MPNLKPFRDYSEHDVINLFAYSGTLPVNKGTFVVPADSNGWKNTDEMSLLGDVGASYGNVVSERYGVAAKVTAAASGDSTVIGMLLYDVKETDENGEKLVFNPRKAAEMNVAISGQAVPIVTKGVFLYSGAAGTGSAGASAYVTTNGVLTSVDGGGSVVGKFLGAPDADGNILVKISL
jgi:hypothetical protein